MDSKLTQATTLGTEGNWNKPPEPSELVKQITKLEKEFKEAKSELDQIRATLFVNYGSGYREQDGITFDSNANKSTLMIMCDVLRAYSLKLAEGVAK